MAGRVDIQVVRVIGHGMTSCRTAARYWVGGGRGQKTKDHTGAVGHWTLGLARTQPSCDRNEVVEEVRAPSRSQRRESAGGALSVQGTIPKSPVAALGAPLAGGAEPLKSIAIPRRRSSACSAGRTRSSRICS